VGRPALVLAALSLALSASALPLGTADGSLTVAGKAVHLTHAYAWRTQNPFPPKEARVMVLLSESEVPASALGKQIELFELAHRGGLAGFEFEIAPQNDLKEGVVFSSAFPSGWLSVSGLARLTPRDAGPGRVAGSIAMPEPGHWGPPHQEIPFQYSAQFEVEVKP
jgi:hypothetical protein